MLETVKVGKSFGGVRALQDVSMRILPGEVHALMGENGAGKSTLLKILSGVYPDYDGEVRFEGKPIRLRDPQDARRHGIAIIHQELNLVPEMTIAENIFLGIEPRTPAGLLDRARMERETRALLARLHADHLPPDRPVKWLRVGEQQLVEVAKAIAPGVRLLILDEPTSALSAAEIEHLFTVVRSLKAQGVTMIYVSHKLDEVFALADRVTVLRDGRYVSTHPIGEIDERGLIREMVGRPLDDLFPKEAAESGGEVLRVEGLGLETAGRGRALQDISFSLRRGEIVGVAGLMGAGRTELLETLFGVHPSGRVRGRITLGGRARRLASPRDAWRAGIAFVTEDRKSQSLVMTLSVRHNMTLAALRDFLSGGFLRPRAEDEAVRRSSEALRIRAGGGSDARVDTLSGGNQQKVVLAKCLLTRPSVLLLDEPTRGIDVGAKAEIYTLISRLARDGAGILLASSEMPELLAMCDRILVLCEGRLAADLPRAEATQERILEAATARQAARAA